jgi:hypothetical protein
MPKKAKTGEVLPPPDDWRGYATKIAAAWRKTTESIIETGRLLNEAKAEVEHGDWLKLVEVLPFGEDTAQRLMAIARHPVISNTEHVRYFPPSWGTLYELTKVPDKALLTGIKDHAINPGMERKEVALLLGPRRLSKKEKERDEKYKARSARLLADWLADHPGKTVEDAEIAGTCSDTEEGEAAWAEWCQKRYAGRDPLDTPSGPQLSEAEDHEGASEVEDAEDPAGFVVAVVKNATEKAQIAVRNLRHHLTESERAEIIGAIDALIQKWNAVRRKVELKAA